MAILSNSQLTIQVAPLGAELHSISCNGKEYLWQADSAFWGRRAPVLFPIVGKVWNDTYRVNDREFQLGQHGFARDMFFETIDETENEIRFQLIDNPETREVYPFFFCLQIGYKLIGKSIQVTWKVVNTDPHDIYFQIGAHPGFYYPDFNPTDEIQGYIGFDRKDELNVIRIAEKGCVDVTRHYPLELEKDGLLPICSHTFDYDALILEDGQVQEVTIYNKEKKPYLRTCFDAPVVGVWSPVGKNAPFICLEPWYGRCDRVNFKGEFKDKDWIQNLHPGETFEKSYTIEILD